MSACPRDLMRAQIVPRPPTGNSFFLLFAGCGEPDCDAGWASPGDVIYSSFNMLILGDFDGDAIDATNEYHVTRTVFVMSQFIVAIVLLNLLIAIMGNTYGVINDKEELEYYKLRAALLTELELFESPSQRNFPREFDPSKSISYSKGVHSEQWRSPTVARSFPKQAVGPWRPQGEKPLMP